jgi:hypothetical protein
MIDRALRDRLLTHRDVVEGITVAKLAELLPRVELAKLLTAALEQGRSQKPYLETNLLAAIPVTTLVQHVPLPWVWDHVVVPKIAAALGLKAKEAPAPAPPPADTARTEVALASPVSAPAAAAPARTSAAGGDESVIIVDGGAQDPGMDLEIDDILASDPKPKVTAVPKPAKR